MLAPALGFVLYEADSMGRVPGARATIPTRSILLLPFLQKSKLGIPASAVETAFQTWIGFIQIQPQEQTTLTP